MLKYIKIEVAIWLSQFFFVPLQQQSINNMKKEIFSIKFKNLIISSKAKLTINGYPVRIVCWDRKGTYPNIGLIDYSALDHDETIIEFDNTGSAHIPNVNSECSDIYVEYDPIGISKQARVAYSLLKAPCIERYMKKYGYEKNEEKSWHWNAVNFANVYAKSHTDKLHDDLKEDGDWGYDDDYDWK